MDSMRRENENVPAVGNYRVNAKGDQIKGKTVTKPADQIARENHRVQSAIIHTGLKGPIPEGPAPVIEAQKKTPVKATAVVKPRTKEVELPSGDIIIESEKE